MYRIFPAAHQLVERLQRFLDRRQRIEPVDLEQVDVVGAEPPQAVFDRLNQVKARRADAIRSRAAAERALWWTRSPAAGGL